MISPLYFITLFSSTLSIVSAQNLQVNWQDAGSVKEGAKAVALGLTAWYTGYRPGDVEGNVPDPYHWWHCGAMFGALIDYWQYTGDDQFNKWITPGMLHQMGPEKNFMPLNQTKSMGNDDQGFWGMTAMTAAENGYPDSTRKDAPSWLALAQAVFNTQWPRWDMERCEGGLRWQVSAIHSGYDYKNTISAGCFFSIASRLGRYTGNETYIEWAEKTWDWTQNIGLISKDYDFYDGTDRRKNCSDVNHIQWTYNAGIYLYGASTLWNHTAVKTGDVNNKWRARVDGIIDGLDIFLYQQTNIIHEQACEKAPGGVPCNIDQRSFKAYLSRWMHSTIKVAPWTAGKLTPILEASRRAAVQACVKDGAGIMRCGLQWTTGNFDGSTGIGENMAALEVMLSALPGPGPLTQNTGGVSKSDPNAGLGTGGTGTVSLPNFTPITTGDKAGAAILTVLVILTLLGGAAWMILGDTGIPKPNVGWVVNGKSSTNY